MARWIWCCALLSLWIAPVCADDEPAKPIPDLIRQLDAEDFADRQAASDALAARGKEALPALAEAVAGESAEAATRALEILRKHHLSSDAELKAAAKETLEKIAAGEGAPARRAADVLNPKPAPDNATTPAVPLRPRIRAVPGGGIARIAIAGGGAGARRISVKDIDGVKEIEAVEEGRTVKINEDATSIKVKVTEKKDGKEETKEYEAKNADELKEKHPEGHKLYEQYAKGGFGEIRLEGVRIEALPGGGFAPVPIAPAIPGIAPPVIRRLEPPTFIREPRELTDRLDKARKQLEEASEKLKKSDSDAASIKSALEAIEAAQAELKEVRGKFPE